MTTIARDERMRQWESAEISRSRIEADLTRGGALKLGAKTLARYASPPAATPYPLEYAYHLLGDVNGKRVLDFGCGSGSNSVLIARRGARVSGIDISESLVRMGNERLKDNGVSAHANLLVGSAHDLPFESNSMDVVFGIAILHHLDLELVAKEVHRVLKPGGRAIFQEPVRNSPLMRFLRRLIPYRAPDISPYERPLTDPELTSFARRFSELRVRAFGLPHVKIGQFIPFLKRRTEWLYRTDGRTLQRFPRLAHYAGIRVLEVTK